METKQQLSFKGFVCLDSNATGVSEATVLKGHFSWEYIAEKTWFARFDATQCLPFWLELTIERSDPFVATRVAGRLNDKDILKKAHVRFMRDSILVILTPNSYNDDLCYIQAPYPVTI